MTLQEAVKKLEKEIKEAEPESRVTVEDALFETLSAWAELVRAISRKDKEAVKDEVGYVYMTLVTGRYLSRRAGHAALYKAPDKVMKAAGEKHLIKRLFKPMQDLFTSQYEAQELRLFVKCLHMVAYEYGTTLEDCLNRVME